MPSNYKLIVRNTFFLYFRLLVVALLGLITSRAVLLALGVRGFGLYTVVGGLVMMLSFLQNTMASTTQRYLNYEMGGGDEISQKKIFVSCLYIHNRIALVLILLAETIGLWFLNTWVNIHHDEIQSANIIYQLSILTFVFGIISTPYRAAITARERMDLIALINIGEAALKCLIAFLIFYSPIERIVLYSGCLLLLNIIIFLTYKILCQHLFSECRTKGFKSDRKSVKSILSFSAWIVVGSVATLAHVHGIGLVVNMFFGLAVNAALGIATQVLGLIRNFILSFMSALNPQITKSYAEHDYDVTRNLIMHGCKIGLYLVTLIALPIFIETPYLLNLWLTEVPPYTVIFVRLYIVAILIWSISPPLTTAQLAQGNIRRFQFVLTVISLLHLPLTMVAFKLGCRPAVALYLYILITACMQAYRIWYVCNTMRMSARMYLKDIILKGGMMIILALSVPLVLHNFMNSSLITVTCVMVSSTVCLTLTFYYVLLQKTERVYVNSIIKNRILKSKFV